MHLDQEIRIDNKRCAVIIIKENKVLTMFRRREGREYYTIPGGHMQQGETEVETAEREVLEETSLKVKNIKPAFTLLDYVKDNYDYYFTAEYDSGNLELGGEEKVKSSEENYYELKWIEFDDVKNINMLPKAAKEWILETLVK